MRTEKRQTRYASKGDENPAQWDPVTRTVEIRGIRYSIDLFESWAEDGFPDGTVFQIVKREDGVMTVEEKKADQS